MGRESPVLVISLKKKKGKGKNLARRGGGGRAMLLFRGGDKKNFSSDGKRSSAVLSLHLGRRRGSYF